METKNLRAEDFPGDPDVQRVVTAFAGADPKTQQTVARILVHFMNADHESIRKTAWPWARSSRFDDRSEEEKAIRGLLVRLPPQRFMALPEPSPEILPAFEAYARERPVLKSRERYLREVELVSLYKQAMDLKGLNAGRPKGQKLNASHDAIMARCTELPTPMFNYLHTIGEGGEMHVLIDRMPLSDKEKAELKTSARDRLFQLLDEGVPVCTVNKIQNAARHDVREGAVNLREAIEKRIEEFLGNGKKGGWAKRVSVTRAVTLPPALVEVIDTHVNGCTVGMDEKEREREREIAHDGIKTVLTPIYRQGMPMQVGDGGSLCSASEDEVLAAVHAWAVACLADLPRAKQIKDAEKLARGFRAQWVQVCERGKKEALARKKRLAPLMKELLARRGATDIAEARKAVLREVHQYHDDRGEGSNRVLFKQADADLHLINDYRRSVGG